MWAKLLVTRRGTASTHVSIVQTNSSIRSRRRSTPCDIWHDVEDAIKGQSDRSHGAHHLFSHLPCLHHTVRWYYYFFPGLSKMSSPRNCFFPLARGLWAQFWWLLLHACPQLDLCCQFCPPTECLICFRWSSNQVRHRQGCQRWALASNSWGSAEVSRNQGDIRTDL